MNFELKSDFAPMGDQPDAIRQLVEGVRNGQRAQVLQGSQARERLSPWPTLYRSCSVPRWY